MFIYHNQPKRIDLPRQDIQGKRWYTSPDGNKYPSITTVLGVKEKPELTNWRNSLGPEKADKETKRCADRGTAVHKMAENFLSNHAEPTKGHAIENVKLFNQLKPRLNKINNIRALELSMVSKLLRVAGTADCIAEYDGVLSIIDFKTSNNNKDDLMVLDYFKQATAYAIMYEEMFYEPIENIVILMTVEKGMVPLVFQKSIDNYVAPLLIDIQNFYLQIK